ncbi:hypothetical protein L6654_08075 [Bradyrhizobium sp. WYCCWR 13023]|uniref:Uncharacterized protein n=1 Tax=Bradyrhizobium zhengyangense TaxID=2911009 RepID=A0A9X1U8N2_9BRAD|nr:hypothetical protein [Bradyrhizobium zhengyangense]MCG2626579.1 hypothetical protein [Bradyrhizobium zhengyangense]
MSEQTSDHFTERAVFKCSPELLDVIDRSAAASFTTRSNFLRDTVVERLRREGVIPSPRALALQETGE